MLHLIFMKNRLSFVFGLTCLVALLWQTPQVFAADRASEIVGKLAAEFRAMSGYRVGFAVQTGDQTVLGSYAVQGENYYIAVGDAEVFGTGRMRYEVDNRRREVTLVETDPTSRNLLDNPAHAFDFLDSQYVATLVWERDGKAAVRLVPTVGTTSTAGSITVTVSTATMRPQSLVYDYDGEQVSISVDSVTPLKTTLNSYDKAHYVGYEVIDFR